MTRITIESDEPVFVLAIPLGKPFRRQPSVTIIAEDNDELPSSRSMPVAANVTNFRKSA